MLSIIIPTLNEEKYLPLLLDSIKKQNFFNCEIIVADGGSKDKTVEVAEKYECKVIEGGLLPRGRNNGAKLAKGDTLLFLDADIVLPPNFLNNAVNDFNKRNLGIAGFLIMPLNGKRIDKFVHLFFNKYSALIQKFSPHVNGAILVKKDVHQAIGGFDEKIVFLEDYPYAKAARKLTKHGLIKETFFTSMRRYDKDGRLNVYIKYFLAELHILFLGPIRSNMFNYKFNHYKDT